MAKWTPEEDAQICELRTRGAELDAIADRFPHRSRGAVAKRVQHLIFEGQVQRRGRPRTNERWTAREDALIAHTRRNAFFLFQEDNLGSIQPGKFADLAVLDRDYLTVPVDQIKDIKSVMTIVGGRVVYDASEPVAVAASARTR